MKPPDTHDPSLSGCNNTLQTGQIEIKAYPDGRNEIAFYVDSGWNIGIDWGDGNMEHAVGNCRHTYPNQNPQTIKINTFDIFMFKCSSDSCDSAGTFHELRFGNMPDLELIDCSNQGLTVLDVSLCTALKILCCEKNQLTDLDVSNCAVLTGLDCEGNKLTSLNVNDCRALTGLLCSCNKLISLDAGNCTALTRLDCYACDSITSLNISNCTELSDLICWGNKLTSLDVSHCTALTNLQCFFNELTTLDVSNCTALTYLICYDNFLSASALNTIFNSLPTRVPDDEAEIWFEDNLGFDTCDKTIFERKGWIGIMTKPYNR